MSHLKKRPTQEPTKPGNPKAVLDALDILNAKADGMNKKAKELLDLAGQIH